jgi:hypothetical protein
MATEAVSVRAQFGKPKYGAKTGHKTWRVIENEQNVYRILPPLKSGMEDGTWAIFLAQHFGYGGVDKADAGKTKARPFACPKKENFTTKMVTVSCAECDKIEAQKDLLEARKKVLETEGRTEEEIDSILAPLKSWCKNHNQDRKWYLNVMNEKGEFGVLAIPHKAYQKLKLVRERKEKETGFDPIGDLDNGLWFDFRRTGKGRLTEYDVFVVEETVDVGGRKLKADKAAPLSDAQLEQALKECPDLVVNALMRVVSTEQVAMLVASSGDPEEVDAILGSPSKVESSVSPAKKVSAANAAAQAVKPAAVSTPVMDDEEAELRRQLAEATKRKAAGVKVAPKPAPAPAPEIDEDDDLSPEELEKLFPGKKV